MTDPEPAETLATVHFVRSACGHLCLIAGGPDGPPDTAVLVRLLREGAEVAIAHETRDFIGDLGDPVDPIRPNAGLRRLLDPWRWWHAARAIRAGVL